MESEEEQVPEPAQQSQGRNAFLSWKFNKHFVLKNEKGGQNITVQCNLCLPATNLLSASKESTSNLKKHLKDDIRRNTLTRQATAIMLTAREKHHLSQVCLHITLLH
ncbi:hypothetical protein EYF80_040622 [Liparis tanakae]|uniref:BED-type domain-containing protein n=1 Tax=Liparis tanakae TaxID=230148 RepID=A0A4Z2G8B0_9TELE|nr:hypothetical protein EYF80_040622 [Liparis tanakae]